MSQINPTLWNAICTITQSVSVCQGKGKMTEAIVMSKLYNGFFLFVCINVLH